MRLIKIILRHFDDKRSEEIYNWLYSYILKNFQKLFDLRIPNVFFLFLSLYWLE